MSAEDRAAELLADLEGKADAGIAAVREKSQEIKSRLESGMLNLQSQVHEQPPTQHFDDAPPDLNWDLEAEASAEPAAEPPPPDEEDFRITAPEPVASFKDELDVATDELGIPLGD